MKDPIPFGPFSDYQEVCQKLKIGSLIEYSLSFDPNMLIDMFSESGFKLEYMSPETAEYKKYGSAIMKVIGIKDSKIKFDPIFFDTRMLDL